VIDACSLSAKASPPDPKTLYHSQYINWNEMYNGASDCIPTTGCNLMYKDSTATSWANYNGNSQSYTGLTFASFSETVITVVFSGYSPMNTSIDMKIDCDGIQSAVQTVKVKEKLCPIAPKSDEVNINLTSNMYSIKVKDSLFASCEPESPFRTYEDNKKCTDREHVPRANQADCNTHC